LDDPDNAKVEAPPSLVENSSGNVIVDVASKVDNPFVNAKAQSWDFSICVKNHAGIAKVEVAPQAENFSSSAKVEVSPLVVIYFIDHHIQFTTKRKFPSQDELLVWVCWEAWKIGFAIGIRRSDNRVNGRETFVTVICEIGGYYTKYKNLSKREIGSSMK